MSPLEIAWLFGGIVSVLGVLIWWMFAKEPNESDMLALAVVGALWPVVSAAVLICLCIFAICISLSFLRFVIQRYVMRRKYLKFNWREVIDL